MTHRAFRLRRRPEGSLGADDLDLVDEAPASPADGEALVRTRLLSVDPANRLWMSDVRGYQPPVPVGAVMEGIGAGEVVESRREDLRPGDLVTGRLGWQELSRIPAGRRLRVLPRPLRAPLSAYLGVLGHTGLTAVVGLELGRPAPGETMVVSAAAGAVGSVAGQLGRADGVRVVGIAGGPGKCRHVVEDLGFDACVDRRAEDWREELAAATPGGVDVDFENVGGPIMDEVLLRLNVGARVVLCGMISQYDASASGRPWRGQEQIAQILMQRATMHGFIAGDHAHRMDAATERLAALLEAGRLRHDETVVEGFERLPEALGLLFAGANTGKLLVQVA
ncbi:MAG: Putative oxidoreductase YncB [uncultured Solirubrobacteraceae bacterium]|uniref:Oxidoreductase YncB n=1 Tax=uncultured Solirubrobacteraceae bacterium TaxID=1162706 RepID=A0A6J4SL93_9ACTN|nr:MAG: Putative oxidoreductase YncB [uncultured Solirubrobacteraceae bacterium]